MVSRITPVDNTNFEWIINLGEEKSEKIRCTLTGRKNSAELTIGDGESCHFTYWLINLLGLNSEIVIKARAGELLHRLRNNCAEPVYNFKSDDIECITQERERV